MSAELIGQVEELYRVSDAKVFEILHRIANLAIENLE